MVYADIALFERLVDNLLVNAVKASRRGGVVTASVRRSGSVVTLAVTDCGDGPTADMRVVFDEGGEPSIGAAGLGLRIIGRILRLHRLRSGVETSANGGSRVTIEIPAADSSLAVSGR